MEKVNGYWTDENGNRWNENFYTKKEAEKWSETLKDCTNCTDCRYCTDCTNCTNCTNCTDCTNCTNCSPYCTDCTGCTNCRYCTDCTNCTNCTDCRYCTDCTDCTDCRYCTDCTEFKVNPNRYAFKGIGGNYDNTCAYWVPGEKEIQLVCGCFRGDLQSFEKAVLKKYPSNHPYMKAITIIKTIRNMENSGGTDA